MSCTHTSWNKAERLVDRMRFVKNVGHKEKTNQIFLVRDMTSPNSNDYMTLSVHTQDKISQQFLTRVVGTQFFSMDDSYRSQSDRLVDGYLESETIQRMRGPAKSQDLNPVDHVWDTLGRTLLIFSLPPPRTLLGQRRPRRRCVRPQTPKQIRMQHDCSL
ncbi:hypothetical protein TNCV_3701791 [Trichonephila clavipes]|nr:hypothetical protein TNCV_3701791 [Trichonephila clavipes]